MDHHHHQENSSKNMKGLQKNGGNREKIASTRHKFLVEDVNKLADDFIKNFRKQLKFEREKSFKQFQEMLSRGT